MDMTKPKGEVVGSITLHFNSKMRVSHVEIKDRGDLVSKRTIQDSMMLIFRAINQQRAKRKTSGRAAAAEEVRQAESRDTSRLELYKKKIAEQKAKEEAELIEQALARKAEKDLAAEKAKIPVKPGHKPKAQITKVAKNPKLTAEDKKAAAKEEADRMLKEVLAAKSGSPDTQTKPVTAE